MNGSGLCALRRRLMPGPAAPGRLAAVIARPPRWPTGTRAGPGRGYLNSLVLAPDNGKVCKDGRGGWLSPANYATKVNRWGQFDRGGGCLSAEGPKISTTALQLPDAPAPCLRRLLGGEAGLYAWNPSKADSVGLNDKVADYVASSAHDRGSADEPRTRSRGRAELAPAYWRAVPRFRGRCRARPPVACAGRASAAKGRGRRRRRRPAPARRVSVPAQRVEPSTARRRIED